MVYKGFKNEGHWSQRVLFLLSASYKYQRWLTLSLGKSYKNIELKFLWAWEPTKNSHPLRHCQEGRSRYHHVLTGDQTEDKSYGIM